MFGTRLNMVLVLALLAYMWMTYVWGFAGR